MRPRLATSLIAIALLATGCASMSGSDASQAEARAPAPAKPIDVARFYTGRWYEIARTPMKLTKGCVAGLTDYFHDAQGRIMDQDSCRMGSPAGKEKDFTGPVTILDPGQNTKVRVDYQVFGFIPVPRTYWMLDHGDDYGWFIVSDPAFKNVSIFTRTPRPAQSEVDALTARVRQLGYDPGKLEHPAEFPAGTQ